MPVLLAGESVHIVALGGVEPGIWRSQASVVPRMEHWRGERYTVRQPLRCAQSLSNIQLSPDG